MKIITGIAKGMNLETLEGDNTRPTSQRVKEAIFSMIQFDIEGRKVLDLFAGSGQLALEALSRGAEEAVLCDSSKQAADIIKKNAVKTRLSEKVKLHVCDSLKLIPKLGYEKFDLVFLDPPYALKMYTPALRALIKADMLKPTTLIICESGEEQVFDGDSELASLFSIEKQTRYSKTFITVFKPNF